MIIRQLDRRKIARLKLEKELGPPGFTGERIRFGIPGSSQITWHLGQSTRSGLFLWPKSYIYEAIIFGGHVNLIRFSLDLESQE